MREISVTYTLDDEYIARLEKLAQALTEQSQKAGYKNGFTVESAFCSIMQTGSRWDINDKLSFAEWQAGLISYEQMQEQKEAWKNKDKGATK